MTLEIQILAWYRHKNVAVLNLLMGSQHYSLVTTLLLTGSPMAIHKQAIKTCTDSLLLKKTTAHVALYHTSQKLMTSSVADNMTRRRPGEIDFDVTAISWNWLSIVLNICLWYHAKCARSLLLVTFNVYGISEKPVSQTENVDIWIFFLTGWKIDKHIP